MGFADLPRDWPHRPLTDAVLAADVLDLCVRDDDRRAPGLAVLYCRPDATLAQPCVVTDMQSPADWDPALRLMLRSAATLPGVGGVLLGLIRPEGGLHDHERRLHQGAIEVCREAGVRLVGAFLVSARRIEPLPRLPTRRIASGRFDVA